MNAATVTLSRADGVVTDNDISKVINSAEQTLPASEKNNRRIIHAVPISFSLDGEQVYGEPKSLKGKKLEAKVLFITCLERHLNDLVEVINDQGVEILDIVASPIAASLVTLSKAQKVAGVVLANIGSETVSVVVYENNIPISLAVFPVGSTNITNSIALGLKIPIEEAESVKKGIALSEDYPKKKIDDIIESKVYDILDLIHDHLKKINRNALLRLALSLPAAARVSAISTIWQESLSNSHRVSLFSAAKTE